MSRTWFTKGGKKIKIGKRKSVYEEYTYCKTHGRYDCQYKPKPDCVLDTASRYERDRRK